MIEDMKTRSDGRRHLLESIRRKEEMEREREEMIVELKDALDRVNTLRGVLAICMHCHKIRDDRAVWERLEHYIAEHSEARFSHGLCPECLEKYCPENVGRNRVDVGGEESRQ